MYDENDRLTRAGAEQVIRDGGTVHLTRRTLNPDGTFKTLTREYKTVSSLPSEVEFAVDDPSAHQKALEGLKAQREQLDAQERKILEGAKAQDQARKAAEAAQKDRERAEAKNPQAAPTLHQQLGGRQLSGAENPLAEQEANEQAERAKAAAEAADPRRQQQPSGGRRAAADDEDKPKAHGHGHK
jgi:hypothetical protein